MALPLSLGNPNPLIQSLKTVQTMKKQLLLCIAVAMLGTTFFACEKTDETSLVEESITTSEDLTAAQNLIQDTEDELEVQIETRSENSEDCPTITVSPDDGSFPKTITIDYGIEGCEGPNGRLRKGQIIVTYSDTLINAGATRTVTFNGFSVDDAQISGTKVLTNLGANELGQPAFTRVVSDALIVFPSGKSVSWNVTHTLTQTAGADTPEILDNVFEITGSSSGINRNDTPFEVSITTPLVKSKGCRWIESGVKEVVVDGVLRRSIDYGTEGNCDRIATVTFANGASREVLIRPWWRL